MNEAIHRATLVNATPNSVLFGNNTFLNNSGDDGGDVVDATIIIPQFNPISDPIGIDLYFQCLLFNEPTIVPLLPLSSSLSSPVVSSSPGLGPVLSSSAAVMMEKTVPSSSSSSSTLPPPPHRRRCDDPDFNNNNNNNSNINNNNNTHNMGGILGLLLLPVPQFMNINRCRYSNNTNNNNDTESTATLSAAAAAAATTIKNTTFETDNNTKAKPNNNNKSIPIIGTKEAYNYLKSVALHIRVLEWALAGGDDDDDDDCDYNGYGDGYGDDSYGDDGYSNDDYDDDNDDCNNEYESNSNNNNNNNNDMDMEMEKEEENGINDHRNDNVFWKTNHQKKSLPYYANDILEVILIASRLCRNKPSLISSSGIIPALSILFTTTTTTTTTTLPKQQQQTQQQQQHPQQYDNIISTSTNNVFHRAYVIYLQCAKLAKQYRYAARLIQNQPITTTTTTTTTITTTTTTIQNNNKVTSTALPKVKHVYQYHYQCGMILLECGYLRLARAFFRDCCSVPSIGNNDNNNNSKRKGSTTKEHGNNNNNNNNNRGNNNNNDNGNNNINPIVIEAYKKLLLIGCLLSAESYTNDFGSSSSSDKSKFTITTTMNDNNINNGGGGGNGGNNDCGNNNNNNSDNQLNTPKTQTLILNSTAMTILIPPKAAEVNVRRALIVIPSNNDRGRVIRGEDGGNDNNNSNNNNNNTNNTNNTNNNDTKKKRKQDWNPNMNPYHCLVVYFCNGKQKPPPPQQQQQQQQQWSGNWILPNGPWKTDTNHKIVTQFERAWNVRALQKVAFAYEILPLERLSNILGLTNTGGSNSSNNSSNNDGKKKEEETEKEIVSYPKIRYLLEYTSMYGRDPLRCRINDAAGVVHFPSLLHDEEEEEEMEEDEILDQYSRNQDDNGYRNSKSWDTINDCGDGIVKKLDRMGIQTALNRQVEECQILHDRVRLLADRYALSCGK